MAPLSMRPSKNRRRKNVLNSLFLIFDGASRFLQLAEQDSTHLAHRFLDCAPYLIENAFLLPLSDAGVLTVFRAIDRE